MGTYIHFYPSSDEYIRLGQSLWPEMTDCLKYANEKDFDILINLSENGILDEDQIALLSQAFEKHENMIHDWFYNLPSDYPFEESLSKALWDFVNRVKSMDRFSPGLIQVNLSIKPTEDEQ